MSNSMMINCVSKTMPPARSMFADAQLVHNPRKADSIINSIYKIIKNFTNRFMRCGQNTVVSLMGSIQHCIFFKTGRIFYPPVNDGPCSDGIMHEKRNVRCNNHEHLTKIRKSEKSLQYSNSHTMIEADMCYNCNNYNDFNNEKQRKRPLREEKQTISNQLGII